MIREGVIDTRVNRGTIERKRKPMSTSYLVLIFFIGIELASVAELEKSTDIEHRK